MNTFWSREGMFHTSSLTMSYAYFRVDYQQDGVVEVVLNRPNQFNVVDDNFFEELYSILNEIEANEKANVVLLWAEGKLFTAGLDLAYAAQNLMPSNQGGLPAMQNVRLWKKIKRWQSVFTKLNTIQKPVVACIHGKCIGAGVDLITACDIRLCTEDASFSVAEVKVGIVADVGTLQRISKVTSRGFAREMAFTGDAVSAARALQFGLVNRLYKNQEDLLKGGRELCRVIAGHSPLVVQGTKVAMNYADEHTTSDSLDHVALWNSAFLGSDDLMEAVKSFFEKRKPTFRNKL